MSWVVSDAGPLIHLAQVGKLNLLKALFQKVLITSSVKFEAYDSGVKLGFSDAEVIGQALEENWISVEVVCERIGRVAIKLAEGEAISRADAETLLLAKERKADLLVDDKVLGYLAKMYGLRVWNTWTLLLESLSRDLIEVADVEDAVASLGKQRFRLSEKEAIEIIDAAKYIVNRKKFGR